MKFSTLALTAILLMALLVRFWGINHTVWSDENKVVSPAIELVKGGRFPLFSIPDSRYPHLSIYLFSLGIWPLKIISQDVPVDYFYWVSRGIGACLNVLLVWLVFVAGKRLGGTPVGLIAAALMAMAPLHVKYSHYAHAEIPGVTLMMLVVLVSLSVWKTGRARSYLLAGLLIGASGATQLWALAIGASLLLAHAGWVKQENISLNRILRPAFLIALALIPIGFFMVSPGVILEYEKNIPVYQQLSLRGQAGDLGHTRDGILWTLYNQSSDWGLPFTSAGFVWETGLLVSLMALVGLAWAVYKKDWVVVVMLGVLFVIVWVAITAGLKLYAVKRLMSLTPLVVLLAAYGINKIRTLSWKPMPWLPPLAAYTILVAALAVNSWAVGGFISAYAGGSTHEIAVKWAEENIPYGSTILQHSPLKLLEIDDVNWKVIRLNEVYANFNSEDPEVSHDRATPIEKWVTDKNVDFIAMDSRIVDRYFDTTSMKLYPETTASYREFYDSIRKQGKQVFLIEPKPWQLAGPRVEIYDVRGLVQE